MWIYENLKAVFFALPENFNRIIHKFIIVFSAEHWKGVRNYMHATVMQMCTHGPSCSNASQKTGKRKTLNPHPLRRAKCTSAEPSSSDKGLPMKELLPVCPPSQSSSLRYEGSFTGAFEEPERLTPRSRSVRPELSTKLPSTVCTKCEGVCFPVAGDTEGIRGMGVRGKGN